MATGLEINASVAITGGNGVFWSPDLAREYYTYFSLPTPAIVDTFCTAAKVNAGTDNGAYPLARNGAEGGYNPLWGSGLPGTSISTDGLLVALDSLGQGVTQNNFLIDCFSANAGYRSSGAGTYTFAASTPSVTGCLLNQAQAPFTPPTPPFTSRIDGMAKFGNVFSVSTGWCSSAFETTATTTILKNTTYQQTKPGYASQLDLATNGIAYTAPLIYNTIKNWGTIYDVRNIGTMVDVYVFGQNLLNQQLGKYGHWDMMLANVGLDTSNLSSIPQQQNITVPTSSSTFSQSPVGQIEYPTTTNVTVSTRIAGSSPDVVKAIYNKVTGNNLETIVIATGFVPTTAEMQPTPILACVTVLTDFLSFDKVVSQDIRTQWADLGVGDFETFAAFLNDRLGQGYFGSWKEMGDFLLEVDVPSQDYTVTPKTKWPPKPSEFSQRTVITQSVAEELSTAAGTGSGEFNTPLIWDVLGASAGIPYTDVLQRLIVAYNQIPAGDLSPVTSALNGLNDAVNTAIDTKTAIYRTESGGGGDGETSVEVFDHWEYDTGPVTDAINIVNASVQNVPQSAPVQLCNQLWFRIQDRMTLEHTNAAKAGIDFVNAGSDGTLKAFAGAWSRNSTNKDSLQTYQFFANMISNDVYGDTLRACRSEAINSQLFNKKGITNNNDPDPRGAMIMSKAQKITTQEYMNRNKG